MKCRLCQNKSVYKEYCKVHYNNYFEKKARSTILRFGLLKKKDRVAVAVSGGKDSMSLLKFLHKYGYNVTAIAVDEGIFGYRDKTLVTMVNFCKSENIPYKIISFKKTFGKTLDEIMDKKKIRPCTVCGVFRRYILNVAAKEYDVIATGHNLDDEAQAVVMNLVKSNISLIGRLGPVSGSKASPLFPKRVKPFYLLPEKEVMIYSFLNGLNTEFNECPNVGLSFRLRVRDRLNEIESKQPGTKNKIVEWLLSNKNNFMREESAYGGSCKLCGEPATKEVCNACLYASRLQ